MTTKISSDLWILKQHGSKRISQGVGLLAAIIRPIQAKMIISQQLFHQNERKRRFVSPPRIPRYNLFKVK